MTDKKQVDEVSFLVVFYTGEGTTGYSVSTVHVNPAWKAKSPAEKFGVIKDDIVKTYSSGTESVAIVNIVNLNKVFE